MDGGTILAQALRQQGVEYMFGIVGVPVIEFSMAAQQAGIKYVGMRNEQAAAYAAQIMGYITRKPAVCLTVSGPGLLHVLAGMENAKVNAWPMIVIAGSCESSLEAMGAFQECLQVEAARPFCKFAARPSSAARIPFYVEKAVRTSLYGRPGPCYLDLSAEMFTKTIPEDSLEMVGVCPPPPVCLADPDQVRRAARTLSDAIRPLVIIGKGAAYCRAEGSIRRFVEDYKLPFIPTPMGKGLLPDDHQFCVAPARSRALQQADVILLLGARLNWILHFGQPPRFQPNVQFIQIDISPEELHNNMKSGLGLFGDIDSVVRQLQQEMAVLPGSAVFSSGSDWWTTLRQKAQQNRDNAQAMVAEPSPPMNYYNAFYEIEGLLPRDCMFVAEGSNTMDISRTMFNNSLPRHRLDAATYGTMGLGAGFAIAAALWCRDYHPEKRVICLQGDSAFGFGGMEVETICRYKLPIIFIVINNNGIGFGATLDDYEAAAEGDITTNLSPTGLLPEARYDQVMEAFGGRGYLARTREELHRAVQASLSTRVPSLINTLIQPMAAKKTQEFLWLTSKV